MKHTRPTVADLAAYDTIIDVRSPAEFAEDHIPGAISCPVLDDAQRAELGDMYQRHRDMTLEQARQEELAELKRMTEETIGVELGAEPIADEQELMRRMLEGILAKEEEHAEDMSNLLSTHGPAHKS